MALEKAKIKTEQGEEFTVQFNPAEYELSSSVTYSNKTITGLSGPISQFVSGSSDTLSMKLVFDTYEPPTMMKSEEGGTDVTKETMKVVKLMDIVGSLHRPPIVTFSWGKLNFKGLITDIKQSYTMFLASGVPVRANLDVTFKSFFDTALSKKQAPFESPDRTKYKVVQEGEYLWNYAYEEYGNPDLWRVIAKENGIINPLDIKSGQILKIPAI